MFFKKNKNEDKDDDLAKVTALLIHAAKIDEKFLKEEEEIIKSTLLRIGAKDSDLENIIKKGCKIEENSNQILDFTTEVKNMDEQKKIKIIEALWQIIYSDKKADIYETNLMRRLAGLLYIDDKMIGIIKDKIKREKSE